MKKYFVTGIGTSVGKTVASAVLTEALEADYWKPIQAGDLDCTDTDRVRELISNKKSFFHQSTYSLKTPMSPHAPAAKENLRIRSEEIVEPETSNSIVIEGAGGLLVPLSHTETIADLIKPDYQVIVVSRHYLGSINHTLLTTEMLRLRNITCHGIIFIGDKNPSTEDAIIAFSGIRILGRIEEESHITKGVIKRYADLFKESLGK